MRVQLDLQKLNFFIHDNVPAIFNAESRRHWLARPVTWSAISGIAEELLDKGELGASDILRCYLCARNEAQLPLGLDWTPGSADPGDCEYERSAA